LVYFLWTWCIIQHTDWPEYKNNRHVGIDNQQ